jgi:ATP-dependent Zn protease
MTAYHEAGHAVLSMNLLPQVIIEQVTVAPRSEALGFVSYKDENFITTATKDEIFKKPLCVDGRKSCQIKTVWHERN